MSSRHPLQYMIRPDTMRAHRVRWYVYSGPYGELEPVQSGRTYAGMGYEAMCSCGAWQSRTGGALRRSVEDAVWDHRYDEQGSADIKAGQERDSAFIAEREADYERHLKAHAPDWTCLCTRIEWLGMSQREYEEWKQTGIVAPRVMRVWETIQENQRAYLAQIEMEQASYER
jgi:hypothetical protein